MLTRRAFGISAAGLALAWAIKQAGAKDKDPLFPEMRVAYLTVQDDEDGELTNYMFVSYQPDGQTRPQIVWRSGKSKYVFAHGGVEQAMHSLPVDLWVGSVAPGDTLTCVFEQEKDGRTWAVIRVQKKEQKKQ